jgi:DNA polymerase/3'-5' exonuclease PolX
MNHNSGDTFLKKVISKKDEPSLELGSFGKAFTKSFGGAPLMNQAIIEYLKEQSYFSKDNPFKIKAYTNAINYIRSLTNDIQSIEDLNVGESGCPPKGFGKSILEHIQTVLSKNQNDVQKNSMAELFEKLKNIYGIGPKKADELINKHGIKSFEDLRLREMDLLNDKQRIGLKYYEDCIKRIPYNEMKKHNELLCDYWSNFMDRIEFEIVGSFRRRAKNSGDIDVMITYKSLYHPKLFKELIKSLFDEGYLIENLAFGDKKFMGICLMGDNYRRIDIVYCTPEEYPFCLLYFTGCGEFNRKMRELALKKGYSLNEYGLTQLSNKKIISNKFNSETSIFEFLNLPYILPENRTENILNSYI